MLSRRQDNCYSVQLVNGKYLCKYNGDAIHKGIMRTITKYQSNLAVSQAFLVRCSFSQIIFISWCYIVL